MWPDRVSNPGLLTYESGALPTALRGPAWACDRDRLDNFLIPVPLEATYGIRLQLA